MGMADGWYNYRDKTSRFYSEPRNHCLRPGGSEYSRYLWVRDQIAPGARVLDVGCNCGQLAENLTRDLGCKVVGVDVVDDFVNYCDAEKGQFGYFYCMDFGEEGIIPARWFEEFDVVTALEVIEHAINVRGFLYNVKEVLKPGGKLIVTTPHPRGMMGYGQTLEYKAHWRMWTPWRLCQAFGEMAEYAEIRRDECGRLLSMGAVFEKAPGA